MIIEEFEGNGEVENCSFCGDNKPSGVWMGENVIFCCKPCALDYLPQLMADTIVSGTLLKNIEDPKQVPASIHQEKHILSRYYSAFSSALIRKLRMKKS